MRMEVAKATGAGPTWLASLRPLGDRASASVKNANILLTGAMATALGAIEAQRRKLGQRQLARVCT